MDIRRTGPFMRHRFSGNVLTGQEISGLEGTQVSWEYFLIAATCMGKPKPAHTKPHLHTPVHTQHAHTYLHTHAPSPPQVMEGGAPSPGWGPGTAAHWDRALGGVHGKGPCASLLPDSSRWSRAPQPAGTVSPASSLLGRQSLSLSLHPVTSLGWMRSSHLPSIPPLTTVGGSGCSFIAPSFLHPAELTGHLSGLAMWWEGKAICSGWNGGPRQALPHPWRL